MIPANRKSLSSSPQQHITKAGSCDLKEVGLYPCRRAIRPIRKRGRAQEEHTWVVKQVCLELLKSLQTHSHIFSSVGQHSVRWDKTRHPGRLRINRRLWRWVFCGNAKLKEEKLSYSSPTPSYRQSWACQGKTGGSLEYMWDIFLLFTFPPLCVSVSSVFLLRCHVCHLLSEHAATWLRNIKLVALFLFVWLTSWHSSLLCQPGAF